MEEHSNIEKITSKIIEDARSKADEIIEEAKTSAKEKKTAAKKKGSDAKQYILDSANRTAEQAEKKMISAATIRARTTILESKEKLIREAFEKASTELEKMSDNREYGGILKKIATDTCEKIGGGDLELIVRKKDVEILKKELKKIEDSVKKSTGKKTSLKISGTGKAAGVIVINLNDEIQIDSTFKNRLELLRPELRLKVAEVLFK